MEKKLRVKVINHKDVHGRDMWYLKIEEYFISIGEKTFNKVKEMIDDVAELEIEKEAKKPK